MNCKEVRMQLLALIEDDLPVEQREAVEAVLVHCSEYQQEYLAARQARSLLLLFRSKPGEAVPLPDFESRLMELLKQRRSDRLVQEGFEELVPLAGKEQVSSEERSAVQKKR